MSELVPKLRFGSFHSPLTTYKLIDLAENGLSNGVFNDSEKVGSGYRLINVKDMYVGEVIDVDSLTFLDLDLSEFERNRVKYGDIFFTRSSIVPSGIAYSNVNLSNASDLTFDGHLMKMSPIQSLANPAFLAATFKTWTLRKRFIARGKQSTMTTIGQNDIADIPVALPQIQEQQKIADFLTSVDTKISQLTEKHRLLKEYKKGVMQQIFSKQIRFKDENGEAFPEWEVKRLANEITEFKSKSTTENEFEVLTSSRNGLIKQSDYYGEGRITDRSNIGFHIIPNGYVTFRSRSDDRLFFFNINTTGTTGIISHYYPVFTMKNGQNHFFIELTRYYSHEFGKYAVGTSQVVLSYKALGYMKFSFPCTAEQQKIAQYLQAIDAKIDAVNQQIEDTKLFKKGLLQQMFV